MTLLKSVYEQSHITADVETSIITLTQPTGVLKFDTFESCFFAEEGGITAIGISHNKIYVATRGDKGCRILVYVYTPQYVTEQTCIDIHDRVAQVDLIHTYGELVFCNEILHKSSSHSHSIVTVYSYDDQSQDYVIHSTLTPTLRDINDYGLSITVTDTLIILLGLYDIQDLENPDTCYSLTAYAHGKIFNLLTGISHSDIEYPPIAINDDIISIGDHQVAKISEAGLTLLDNKEALLEEYMDDTNLTPVTDTQVPIVTDRPPYHGDTKQLPDTGKQTAADRQAMITRQHLLIQQLLNNMSIAIKEDRVERFSIKTLEMTEERIRITGLEFIPRG